MLKVGAWLMSVLFLCFPLIPAAQANMAELPVSEVLSLAKSGNAEAQDELGLILGSRLHT